MGFTPGWGAKVETPGCGAGVFCGFGFGYGDGCVGTGATPVTIGGAGVLGFGIRYPGVGGTLVGGVGHEATLQQVGSFGSGTRVQVGGRFGYFAHLS